MLLIIFLGAKSYEHLRTFEGIVHPTFRAAYIARGLEEDDREWD